MEVHKICFKITQISFFDLPPSPHPPNPISFQGRRCKIKKSKRKEKKRDPHAKLNPCEKSENAPSAKSNLWDFTESITFESLIPVKLTPIKLFMRLKRFCEKLRCPSLINCHHSSVSYILIRLYRILVIRICLQKLKIFNRSRRAKLVETCDLNAVFVQNQGRCPQTAPNRPYLKPMEESLFLEGYEISGETIGFSSYVHEIPDKWFTPRLKHSFNFGSWNLIFLT